MQREGEWRGIIFNSRINYIIYLYLQMQYAYIEILNYITNAPTCFSASAPSSGSFDIAFVKVIRY